MDVRRTADGRARADARRDARPDDDGHGPRRRDAVRGRPRRCACSTSRGVADVVPRPDARRGARVGRGPRRPHARRQARRALPRDRRGHPRRAAPRTASSSSSTRSRTTRRLAALAPDLNVSADGRHAGRDAERSSIGRRARRPLAHDRVRGRRAGRSRRSSRACTPPASASRSARSRSTRRPTPRRTRPSTRLSSRRASDVLATDNVRSASEAVRAFTTAAAPPLTRSRPRGARRSGPASRSRRAAAARRPTPIAPRLCHTRDASKPRAGASGEQDGRGLHERPPVRPDDGVAVAVQRAERVAGRGRARGVEAVLGVEHDAASGAPGAADGHEQVGDLDEQRRRTREPRRPDDLDLDAAAGETDGVRGAASRAGRRTAARARRRRARATGADDLRARPTPRRARSCPAPARRSAPSARRSARPSAASASAAAA